jgi:hypothetical protein
MKNRLFALTAALLASACASYDGRGLVAGASTESDVQAAMGAPAEKISAGEERVWFYPHAPAGRDTYAVRIGANGRVISIEQRLTEENFARLAAGNTTRQVRELLGPPNRAFRNDRQQRVVWEYLYYNVMQVPFILYVQASDDGIVREVVTIRDPSQDMPGGYS